MPIEFLEKASTLLASRRVILAPAIYAEMQLEPHENFTVKIFQGNMEQEYVKPMWSLFKILRTVTQLQKSSFWSIISSFYVTIPAFCYYPTVPITKFIFSR